LGSGGLRRLQSGRRLVARSLRAQLSSGSCVQFFSCSARCAAAAACRVVGPGVAAGFAAGGPRGAQPHGGLLAPGAGRHAGGPGGGHRRGGAAARVWRYHATSARWKGACGSTCGGRTPSRRGRSGRGGRAGGGGGQSGGRGIWGGREVRGGVTRDAGQRGRRAGMGARGVTVLLCVLSQDLHGPRVHTHGVVTPAQTPRSCTETAR
jgi:hypothetical protein